MTDAKRVEVGPDGAVPIPESVRTAAGIDRDRELFVSVESGRIVLTPVPTLDELHGIHADDREDGEAIAEMRAWRRANRQMERRKRRRLIERYEE